MSGRVNEIDSKIIEEITKYYRIRFDVPNYWFNCNLHNANDEDFNTFTQMVSNLKNNNETLFKFILAYYFEQVGFNAKFQCDKCDKKKFIKTHAVAMIKSFNEVKFLTNDDFPKKWFEKFREVYKKMFDQKFNGKKLKINNFKSLYGFYKGKGVDDLRNKIEDNEIRSAFDLLKGIKGIGEKVAKFTVRDLVFYFTDWGKSVKMVSPPENLEYAIPIDRWVRRVTLSIPSLRQRIFKLLEDEDLDRFISKAIVEVCSELELNPLRFDFGAYQVGVDKLERKWNEFNREKRFSETYECLKEIFV